MESGFSGNYENMICTGLDPFFHSKFISICLLLTRERERERERGGGGGEREMDTS